MIEVIIKASMITKLKSRNSKIVQCPFCLRSYTVKQGTMDCVCGAKIEIKRTLKDE